MKNYENFDGIHKFDIQIFNGLETEKVTHFFTPYHITLPLLISCFGITYPNPKYYIKRFPVRNFILEHIISGKGYCIIDDKKYTISAGDTYLLKAGENCEYFADKDDPYHKVWVNFNGKLPAELINLYSLKDSIYKNVNLSPLFEKLFKLDEVSVNFTQIQFEATAIITEMLMLLAKSINTNKNITKLAAKIADELCQSINKPYSLDELSKKLFISKSEIIRQFKKSYNITPYQYLIEIKINYAKIMLKNNTRSITEISEHLGFNSPYHFSNTFKQKTGISPIKYRQSVQN